MHAGTPVRKRVISTGRRSDPLEKTAGRRDRRSVRRYFRERTRQARSRDGLSQARIAWKNAAETLVKTDERWSRRGRGAGEAPLSGRPGGGG